MKNEINQQELMRMFYICGSIIFLVVGIANTITNYIFWNNLILSAKVSNVASNLFNYVLSVFFFGLIKSSFPKKQDLPAETLDEIFKEAKK